MKLKVSANDGVIRSAGLLGMKLWDSVKCGHKQVCTTFLQFQAAEIRTDRHIQRERKEPGLRTMLRGKTEQTFDSHSKESK